MPVIKIKTSVSKISSVSIIRVDLNVFNSTLTWLITREASCTGYFMMLSILDYLASSSRITNQR
jgi:hypothetical protein